MGQPQVIAVVVTYNRRRLLERILTALAASTRLPDGVVVVDNASTDDTQAFLASFDSPLSLQIERLPENLGGAGGFAAGLDAAVRAGADYVWLMDDDGAPDPACLEQLLAFAEPDRFIGPAVVAESDAALLCFTLRLPGSTRLLKTYDELVAEAKGGLADGVIAAFNGVLISSDLVARLGLPRVEYFIWGDETEYKMRAEAAGARIATVPAARFSHPSDAMSNHPMFFGRMTFVWASGALADLKNYCGARNNVATLRRYRGVLFVLGFMGRLLWFTLFTRRDLHGALLGLRAAFDGWRGDFTRHPHYLAAARR
ncbi:MAG: glycosyltransferase [Aeromicrobium sp.]|uniref:glycosyltransferase n=1 Tax=Aeromicrobium sp. TaxID=1871063 RepID=UPI0039E72641